MSVEVLEFSETWDECEIHTFFLLNDLICVGRTEIAIYKSANWLSSIFVKEEFRKKGLAKMMLELALEKFKNENPIKLNVNVKSLTTISFYENSGFKLNGFGYFSGSRENYYVEMEKL